MKARLPKKFMNVSIVKVSPEDGVLSRSMTCETMKILMERIWTHRVASDIVCSTSKRGQFFTLFFFLGDVVGG